MSAKKLIFAAFLGFVIAAGCSEDEHGIYVPWSPTGDTVTVSFQDGVFPYPSYRDTRDAMLKDGPAWELQNGNFGFVTIDTLGAVYLAGEYYERRLILRMDLSYVTGCVSVLDAKLLIRIEPDISNSLVLEAYEVILPAGFTESWPEGVGGIGTGVSWLHIDGAMPWDKPGGDYAEGLLDEQSVDGNSTVSFTLPNALVLNWIRYPSKNHGVIIKIRDTSGDTFRLVSSRETGTPGHRPKLWLKYLKSG